MKQLANKRFVLVLSLLLGVWLSGFSATAVLAAAETNEPTLRIGLMTKQFGILAESNGSYEIVNVDTNKVQAE